MPREIDVIDAGAIGKKLEKVSDAADRLLLRTIATFGLRIGEALGLQWDCVDFEAKAIHIVRAAQREPKTPDAKSRIVLVDVKTDNSRRALLAPDSLLEELKAHRVAQLERRMKLGADWQDHNLVFPSATGTPLDGRNVLRVLHRAQAVAEVKRTSLHRLRHSAATYMLSQGVDMNVISSILGHSSTAITREFYAKFELVQQKNAALIMGDAFKSKSS